VLQTAQEGTPVLLVRGSGKAADMISDAVLLQYAPSHPAHVKTRNTLQRGFWKFVSLCEIKAEHYNDDLKYDWAHVVQIVKQQRRLLKEEADLKERFVPNEKHTFATTLRQHAQNLVASEYEVLRPNADLDECLKIIVQVLDAAQTGKCWVFDLHSTEPGYDDFNGALLKCLLNGVARTGEESVEILQKKLELTMQWSRDDLMDYLLERMSNRINEKERSKIFNKALLFALRKHKVHALCSLLVRGTGWLTLDVGSGFCFVKHHIRYACTQSKPEQMDKKSEKNKKSESSEKEKNTKSVMGKPSVSILKETPIPSISNLKVVNIHKSQLLSEWLYG